MNSWFVPSRVVINLSKVPPRLSSTRDCEPSVTANMRNITKIPGINLSKTSPSSLSVPVTVTPTGGLAWTFDMVI